MSAALTPEAPRTSAQIIPIPGAAAAPVVNPPRPRGKPPKGIVGIWRGKVLRHERERDAARALEAQANAAEVRASATALLRVALAHLQGGQHV